MGRARASPPPADDRASASDEGLLAGLPELEWALPSELGVPLVDAARRASAPVQGSIGDCWIVGALAALGAERAGGVLSRLAEPPRDEGGDKMSEGLRVFYADGTPASFVADSKVTVCLYVRGAWASVTVGPRLPCTPGRALALAYGVAVREDGGLEGRELWPAYVEKALAALRGGYGALRGGSCASALLALTGGITERLSLRPPPSLRTHAAEAAGADRELGAASALRAEADYRRQSAARLWAQLSPAAADGSGGHGGGGSVAARAVACCLTLERAGAAAGAVDGESGLACNHTYAVLRGLQLGRGPRLLQLADPRGEAAAGGGGWRGAWSRGSAEWETAEGRALRRALLAAGAEQAHPGAFWMGLEQAAALFSRASLCHLPHAGGRGAGRSAGAGAAGEHALERWQPSRPRAPLASHGAAGSTRVPHELRAQPPTWPLAVAWHRAEWVGCWAARCVAGAADAGVRAPVCEWPQWRLSLARGAANASAAGAGSGEGGCEVLISLLPLPPNPPNAVAQPAAAAQAEAARGAGLATLTVVRDAHVTAGAAARAAREGVAAAVRRTRKWAVRDGDILARTGPAAAGEEAVARLLLPRGAAVIVLPALLAMPAAAAATARALAAARAAPARAAPVVEARRFALRVWCSCSFSVEATPRLRHAAARGEWARASGASGGTAGGPPSGAGWCTNPQFWLRVPRGPADEAQQLAASRERAERMGGDGGGGALLGVHFVLCREGNGSGAAARGGPAALLGLHVLAVSEEDEAEQGALEARAADEAAAAAECASAATAEAASAAPARRAGTRPLSAAPRCGGGAGGARTGGSSGAPLPLFGGYGAHSWQAGARGRGASCGAGTQGGQDGRAGAALPERDMPDLPPDSYLDSLALSDASRLAARPLLADAQLSGEGAPGKWARTSRSGTSVRVLAGADGSVGSLLGPDRLLHALADEYLELAEERREAREAMGKADLVRAHVAERGGAARPRVALGLLGAADGLSSQSYALPPRPRTSSADGGRDGAARVGGADGAGAAAEDMAAEGTDEEEERVFAGCQVRTSGGASWLAAGRRGGSDGCAAVERSAGSELRACLHFDARLLAAASGYGATDGASVSVQLQRGRLYRIVPSTSLPLAQGGEPPAEAAIAAADAAPAAADNAPAAGAAAAAATAAAVGGGAVGRFALHAFCAGVPLDLRPVARAHVRAVRGEWRASREHMPRGAFVSSARGSHALAGDGWWLNPQHVLCFAPPPEPLALGRGADGGPLGWVTFRAELRRIGAGWEAAMRSNVVGAMIGLYVLRAPSARVAERVQWAGKEQADVVFETAFTPGPAASVTLAVPAPGTYVLLPATMDAGVEGGYEIAVSADGPFSLEAVF